MEGEPPNARAASQLEGQSWAGVLPNFPRQETWARFPEKLRNTGGGKGAQNKHSPKNVRKPAHRGLRAFEYVKGILCGIACGIGSVGIGRSKSPRFAPAGFARGVSVALAIDARETGKIEEAAAECDLGHR